MAFRHEPAGVRGDGLVVHGVAQHVRPARRQVQLDVDDQRLPPATLVGVDADLASSSGRARTRSGVSRRRDGGRAGRSRQVSSSDVGRAPGQVLAAVDGDHLAGDRASVNQVEDGARDLVGRRRAGPAAWPAPRRRSPPAAWWIEARVGPGPMPLTRMRGARAWASVRVAATERGLGQGVAEELRVGLQHPLVQQVDDRPRPPAPGRRRPRPARPARAGWSRCARPSSRGSGRRPGRRGTRRHC